MKFTAVGDILPQKKILTDYGDFDTIKDYIMQGDARFFNLETTLNRPGQCFASQFSGGTYVRNNPEVLEDILEFGFNMTSGNNNHSLDFSYEGLEQTMDALEDSGIVNAGLGRNLDEAAAPAYLETRNGRAALVSVCTSFNPAMMAGAQSRRTPGRPGINGVRITNEITVPAEAFAAVREIGDKSGINAEANQNRSEGYLTALPEGVCELGGQRFVCGDSYGIHWIINSDDKKRIAAALKEAAARADYVIFSIHTHQNVQGGKNKNPPFIEELAHFAVDSGADAVICHGPHLLRPIEVYGDRPIFYSLGDFLMQLYDVPYAPDDFYAKYGVNQDAGIVELLKNRSNNFTRGLMEQNVALETVIPFWETEGRKLKSLKLMPVKISRRQGMQLEGLPTIPTDLSFIDRLAEMSREYGVKIEMQDGIAVCSW